MSSTLFLRSYLMIVLLILAVGWMLDQVLVYYGEQENIVLDNSHLRGSFLYVDAILTDSRPAIKAAWEQHHATLESALGYPITLYQFSDFSGDKAFLQALALGQIVALSNESKAITYYKTMSDNDHIIAFEPASDKPIHPTADDLVIGVYYLLVAVILFFWLRPFSSALRQLRAAAINFGDNNFSVRVNLNQTSSVQPVADAFNSMAQRIEDLVSAHEDLTHSVSHELKTPLARFKFSLEIIENCEDSSQRQAYLQAMKEDVCELDELIEEMLSYAQFGVHNLKLNLQAVNARVWLQDVISRYELDNNEIEIHLVVNTPEPETMIRIDKHLMNRAVHNLIRNALSYALNQINISLQLAGNYVKLTIEDDGPGIPVQFHDQIFQPFTRLDSSRNRQSGGHGLGLAITQKIVQQHGGRIEVSNSLLGGAGFQLTWPRRLSEN